jgi:exonuclease SbcD
MRIVHTSDWHLGHELHGFDRGFEHDSFLDWLAVQLIELRAEALIVTGDVYDTVNPQIPAQQRLYRFLKRALSENTHLQIILIGGNHDSAARLELPRHLLEENRVHLVGSMPRHDGRPAPAGALIQLRDQTGATCAVCAAIPYLRPGDLPQTVDGESPTRALYREVIEAANAIRVGMPLIVTGHLHLSGGAVSELSERRIIVGGEEAVSSDIFPASVSYAALGHLHKPQSVSGQTVIRYAGSPFPMSVSEKDYRHSIVVIDCKADGLKTALVHTPRPVAFYRVPETGAAPLDVVEKELRSLEIDDLGEHRRPFLEVALLLDGAEPELRQRIENALEGKPLRLTRIVRQTSGQGGTLADRVEAGRALDELDPAYVFARRYTEEYGEDPPDDLRKAFAEVLTDVLSPNDDHAGGA